MLATM